MCVLNGNLKKYHCVLNHSMPGFIHYQIFRSKVIFRNLHLNLHYTGNETTCICKILRPTLTSWFFLKIG